MAGLIEAHIVENVELGFRPEVGDVGDARALQIRFGFFGDLARVAIVFFPRDGVFDVAGNDERRHIEERINEGRIGIGDQDHVQFVDGLKAPNGAAVEGQSLGEFVFVEVGGGNGKVLLLADEVGKPNVNHFGFFLADHVENVFGRHTRLSPLRKWWVGMGLKSVRNKTLPQTTSLCLPA